MLIKDIIVKNRIRKDIGDLSTLAKSMEKHGLLSPIILDRQNNLIAGERRLKAAQKLNWTEIDVIVLDVNKALAVEIELEENNSRKDFNAVELEIGKKRQRIFKTKNFLVRMIYFFESFWCENFKSKK